MALDTLVKDLHGWMSKKLDNQIIVSTTVLFLGFAVYYCFSRFFSSSASVLWALITQEPIELETREKFEFQIHN